MNYPGYSEARGLLVISLVVMAIIFPPAPVMADRLDKLLDKGPVVMLEQTEKGKFKRATSIIKVNASVERVWKVVTDFAQYKDRFPKCARSKILSKDASSARVEFEIEVPLFPNTEYTLSYKLDPKKHTMAARWLKGDLKDSRWQWKLEPITENACFIYYAGTTRNFSGIAERLEDDQQTITVGVNVTSLIATLRTMKVWAEEQK